MMDRPMTGWQTVLRGIAAALAVAHAAAAQSGTSDAGAEGSCLKSEDPAECPDRCPTFDTCYIDDGKDGRLYYRVNGRRFDCNALECRAASASLADYCCQRGQFAPSDDGGGCSLKGVTSTPTREADGALWFGALTVCLAGLLRTRRRGRTR
jgi:hypothetical protein